MRKLKLVRKSLILSFFSVILALMTCCNPVDFEQDKLQGKSPLEISDQIFNDEEFEELRILENKHIFNNFITETDLEYSKNKFNKIALFSENGIKTDIEKDDLAKILGFDDFKEYLNYTKLNIDLDEKYQLSELDFESKIELSKFLSEKQLEFAFNEKNVNSFQSLSNSTKNARLKNTCMACAYDFISCNQGYRIGIYSELATTYFSKIPRSTYNETWSVTFSYFATQTFYSPISSTPVSIPMVITVNTFTGSYTPSSNNSGFSGGTNVTVKAVPIPKQSSSLLRSTCERAYDNCKADNPYCY